MWVVDEAIGKGASSPHSFSKASKYPSFQCDSHAHGSKVSHNCWPVRHLLTDIHLIHLKTLSRVDNLLNCQDGVAVSPLVRGTGRDFISTSRMNTKGGARKLQQWFAQVETMLCINSHDSAMGAGGCNYQCVYGHLFVEESAANHLLNLHLFKMLHPYLARSNFQGQHTFLLSLFHASVSIVPHD